MVLGVLGFQGFRVRCVRLRGLGLKCFALNVEGLELVIWD